MLTNFCWKFFIEVLFVRTAFFKVLFVRTAFFKVLFVRTVFVVSITSSYITTGSPLILRTYLPFLKKHLVGLQI